MAERGEEIRVSPVTSYKSQRFLNDFCIYLEQVYGIGFGYEHSKKEINSVLSMNVRKREVSPKTVYQSKLKNRIPLQQIEDYELRETL